MTGQSQSEIARTYGVSQGRISRLMSRYRTEGEAAFEPRSRAPKTNPAATLSQATINRILHRAGAITPVPAKRPKSSYIRFQASMPNECWQSDFTHYRLAEGTDAEIITWLDDHSRMALHISAHRRITGPIVRATFRQTAATYGIPASTLTG